MSRLKEMGMQLMDMPSGTTEHPLYCSFCGRRHDQVLVLVAGPSVFICDECIDLCAAVAADKKAEAAAITIEPATES